jgi:hypothetical protein
MSYESKASRLSMVPSDLVELDQWVLWRWEAGRKIPYSISGRRASSTDPKTWAPFEAVTSELQRHPDNAGPGFVFVKGGGLVGIDLDDCLDAAGNLKQCAHGLIERFSGSYMERSPSGGGVKIWLRGDLPANVPGVKLRDGSIELYAWARYFTVTGDVFRGAPSQIENHSADLLVLYEYLTRAKKQKDWPLQPLQGTGKIPHGRQHSTLISIAGTLRARRVCDSAILACLLEINRLQCERPGPPENIAKLVRSTEGWNNR